MESSHFNKIFWFIVALVSFGAFFTIYLITIFPTEIAARYADVAMGFWLSTAVGGGIGYLIGSSVTKPPIKADPEANPGTTTAKITADITTTPSPDKTEEKKKS